MGLEMGGDRGGRHERAKATRLDFAFDQERQQVVVTSPDLVDLKVLGPNPEAAAAATRVELVRLTGREHDLIEDVGTRLGVQAALDARQATTALNPLIRVRSDERLGRSDRARVERDRLEIDGLDR